MMAFDDKNSDAFGRSFDDYAAPDVTEQSLDSGGNYVSAPSDAGGGFGISPFGNSDPYVE